MLRNIIGLVLLGLIHLPQSAQGKVYFQAVFGPGQEDIEGQELPYDQGRAIEINSTVGFRYADFLLGARYGFGRNWASNSNTTRDSDSSEALYASLGHEFREKYMVSYSYAILGSYSASSGHEFERLDGHGFGLGMRMGETALLELEFRQKSYDRFEYQSSTVNRDDALKTKSIFVNFGIRTDDFLDLI